MRRGRHQIWACFALVGAILVAAPSLSDPRFKRVRFDELVGWPQDDHAAALTVFLNSCQDISAPEWAPICQFAKTQKNARTFFELLFTPVLIHPDETALFTGYFEPELRGSRQRTPVYRFPIYKKPPDLIKGQRHFTRQEIESGGLLGRGLEIAWVDDPVEAYYLHIQGSGKITFEDGSSIRVGYAGENGHVYRSAARELIRQGEIPAAQASINGVKSWFRKNPEKGRRALWHNASYVFFREVKGLTDKQGPMGALDLPITGLRSIAVDPKYVQMGAPIWVEKGGQHALRRLMIAQDVGSAIKGAQRGDIFFGTGSLAGEQAGNTKNPGRMVVFLPHEIANRLLGDS